MQKREDIPDENNNVEAFEIHENVVDLGDNLPLSKSIKKKKPGKKSIDDNE